MPDDEIGLVGPVAPAAAVDSTAWVEPVTRPVAATRASAPMAERRRAPVTRPCCGNLTATPASSHGALALVLPDRPATS